MKTKQSPAFGLAVVDAYKSGLTISQVAKKFGCHGSAVHRWMRRMRVDARPTRAKLDTDAIIREFNSGDSLKALADRHCIARHAIALRLREAGLQPRGRSDAERLKWSRMTDETRALQVLGAHETRKGLFEDEIAGLIRDAGFPCEQQKPAGRYNLDIALSESPVAIEVCGFAPVMFEATRSRERSEFLTRGGWLLIYVRRNPRRMCLDHVRRELVPLLERSRTDKSVFGRYCVVLSHPDFRPRLEYDFGDIPPV